MENCEFANVTNMDICLLQVNRKTGHTIWYAP